MRIASSSSSPRSLSRRVGIVGLAVAIGTPLGAAISIAPSTAAAPVGGMVRLQGAQTLPVGAQVVGTVVPSSKVEGSVALKSRDAAGLKRYATEVSTRGNAAYHRYLSVQGFRSRFGPTSQATAAVSSFLAGHGLSPTVSSNGLLVTFRGSASSVEAAFTTRLSTVRLRSGHAATATAAPISVPASLSPDVEAVVGLSTALHASPSIVRAHGVTPASGTGRSAQRGHTSSSTLQPSACSDATSIAQQYGGLTDDQIAKAYGASGLYAQGANGTGRRVAIFELEPFSFSDVQSFASCYLGAQVASNITSQVQVHPVAGGQPQGTGSGEAALDIEDVLALAPGASIDVYEAPNTNNGLLLEYNQIVSDNQDSVVSSSWGLCEPLANQGAPGLTGIENTIFEEAAVQGQSTFAAAGDAGSSDCGQPPTLAVDDPGTQPFVTSVGGTTIHSTATPVLETTWNDGAEWGAGGGGLSEVWPQPAWQRSSSVPGIDAAATLASASSVAQQQGVAHDGAFCAASPSDLSSTPCRQVPDVSAQADEFTGAVTIYFSGGWTTIGGTSSATPIWAALVTDAASLQACQSGQGLGFISPSLYAAASSPVSYAASFRDITAGTNDMYQNNAGLYPATTGYDMATGLGAPVMAGAGGSPGLAAFLCGSGVPSGPVVSGTSAGTVALDGSITASVQGTGFEVASSPTVRGVQIGPLALTSGAPNGTTATFEVASPTLLTIAIPTSVTAQLGGGTGGTGSYPVVVTSTSGISNSLGHTSTLTVTKAGTGSNPIPSVTGVATSNGGLAGGNTITVFGAGFTTATGVTVGSVAATSLHVISDTKLTVSVPAFTSGTTQCATSLDQVTDGCQTHVVVTTPGGSSATSTIETPAVAASPGCNCEVTTQADEYDYFVAPSITSATITDDPAGFAGEGGDNTLLLDGAGFDYFALLGVVTGDPTQGASWSTSMVPLSSTQMLVFTPGLPSLTDEPVVQPFQIASSASDAVNDPSGHDIVLSNTSSYTYAGVPKVATLSVTKGPTTGGTATTITGTGFSGTDAIGLQGIAVYQGQVLGGATQLSFTGASDTSLSFLTPASLPGPAQVFDCTASGCSEGTVIFRYFPPGDPVVTSISSSSGPRGGGQTIRIFGVNLGCAVAVSFGRTQVRPTPVPTITGCASTVKLKATVPAGTAGKQVAVRVETLESRTNGSGLSPKTDAARYLYK